MRGQASDILVPHPKGGDAERAATECLRECLASLKLPHVPLTDISIPIPVENWVELHLDIRVQEFESSRFGPDVLGGAIPSERLIFVREDIEPKGRLRFTYAHELGHVVMHNECEEPIFRDSTIEDWREATREREADRFAAAFLLPLPRVMRELYVICTDHKLASDVVARLTVDSPETEELWRRVFLPELASRFDVSFQATLFRFSEFLIRGERPFMPPALRGRLLSAAKPSRRTTGRTLFD